MMAQDRQDVQAMVRGMNLLPKAVSVALLSLLMAGLFLAAYALVSTVRGEAFRDFAQFSVLASILIVGGFSIAGRYYLDIVMLKVMGQYNEATLARGRLKIEIGLKERFKQFIPTIFSWKGLLLLWVVANAFDCISTALALHYGGQEANPSARAADNMYLAKWIGVIILTAMAVFWQWKTAMKFVTTLMCLVVLSNFAVVGMHVVQPNLAGDYPDIETAAFSIQLAEIAVIAAVILWGREWWAKIKVFYNSRFRRQDAVR